jgi:cephalosporin-C deacetylase
MNRSTVVRLVAVLAVVLALGRATFAQEIVANPSTPLGVYTLGQPIAWQVEVRGEGAAQVSELHFVLKKNGLVAVREGVLPLVGGKATVEAALGEPGTLLAEFKTTVGGKEISALAGAAVDPTALTPTLPRPADFDAFWDAKLAEMRNTPAHAVLTPADPGKAQVDYYKIQMNGYRGSRIYGQLAKPKGEGKHPALLIVQWAGVYGLSPSWAINYAELGWLTLNIMPHELPFDQPEEFYKHASETTLSSYTAIGNDDRETSYFLRMYLSCYQAAEYLAHRPDWDGRVLVVRGSSQGGMQSIVTAALEPKITAALANVPAGCDLNGPVVNRAPGWPGWWWRTEGKDARKVREAARYFDVVNFASRVTCPAQVALGLIDTTCPAPGEFVMTNQLRGPKEVIVMPNVGHGSSDYSEGRARIWLDALAKGQAPPMPQ